jgi:ParB-like nuclease domain
MIIEVKKISELKPAPYNPRLSKEKQESNLKASLEKFGAVEPIVWNKQTGHIVGGHFRVRELKKLGYKEIECVIVELDLDSEKELNIRLNANTGEWDWDTLANETDWSVEQLNEWGLDVHGLKETEKLSKLEFEDIYYTPKDIPNISLDKCIDTTKFDAKIKVINESSLNADQKEILKMFAYRFLKIDFESVANYYFFNASDEEQKIIEQLRLVLCDSGLNGFIEDDLLKIHESLEAWDENL